MKYDIIIIGAGCAGLMAMQTLLKQGYSVCMLEAAPGAGGRIATIKPRGFAQPLETGAEFIHGKLPLTLKLLRSADISYQAISGERIGVVNGRWSHEEHSAHWDELLRRLRRQKTDTSISNFLEDNFPGAQYKKLRTAARNFAEGFNLADIDKASVLSIQKEWQQEDQKQYRVTGGYMQLIDYLLSQCIALKGRIEYKSAVKSIEFRKGHAMVTTKDRKKFEAARVISTASIGVLQAGVIHFNPGLGVHADAIQQVGFGQVVKFHMQLKNPFWQRHEEDTSFILTNEPIPTWWTQAPEKTNLLTGWVGGPAATRFTGNSEKALLHHALQSLSSIFKMSVASIKSELLHYRITNWQQNPFVLGGYSYNTVFTEKAIGILSEPVASTIFFAGEAIYSGNSQGTVEAALQSGKQVAEKISKLDK